MSGEAWHIAARTIPSLVASALDHQRDQAGDLAVSLDRVAERKIPIHAVLVAPTVPLALEVAAGLEIGHDPLHRTLGDADAFGGVAQAQFRILGQQKKDVGVIAEKRPPDFAIRLRAPCRGNLGLFRHRTAPSPARVSTGPPRPREG